MSHARHEPARESTAPDERGRIVAAAQRLRERQGARFTKAQLARTAGLSRATLYRRLAHDRALANAIDRVRSVAAGATRDELRAAAIALLNERGLSSLTMESVAARAGLSTATLYRHFESREALLREVVREASSPAPLYEALASEGTVEAVLVRFVELALARMRANPHLLTLVLVGDPEQVRALKQLRRREERLSVAALEFFRRDDVRAQLAPVPPEQHLGALMGLVLGALTFPRLSPEAAAPDARALVRSFLYGALRTAQRNTGTP